MGASIVTAFLTVAIGFVTVVLAGLCSRSPRWATTRAAAGGKSQPYTKARSGVPCHGLAPPPTPGLPGCAPFWRCAEPVGSDAPPADGGHRM
jgi:hypothetical protein